MRCQDNWILGLVPGVLDVIIDPIIILSVQIQHAQPFFEMREIFDNKKTFFLDEIPFIQKFLEHLLIDGLLFFCESYILDPYIVQYRFGDIEFLDILEG